MPSDKSKKINAIWLSLLTGVFLAILKLAVGMVTQSVAILSLAVDSLGDVLSSAFNLFFLTAAEKPADQDHHYGHEKFENFGSLIQGALLIGSAGFVIYRGIQKLILKETVYQIDLGVGTVIACFVLSFIIGKKVKKVGVTSQSELLQMEATHLLMDSYLYLIAIAGLIFSRFGFAMFDPIACFVVAGYIIAVSVKIVKSSFDTLTDKSLTEDQNQLIIGIIKDHSPSILGFDRFKSRKAGSKKFINFRLFLCKEMSLGKAHDVLDHIEKEIESKIQNSEVMAHAEPAKEDCSKHEHELHPRHFRKSD